MSIDSEEKCGCNCKKKNKALNKWMEVLPLLLKINFEQGKNKDKTKH